MTVRTRPLPPAPELGPRPLTPVPLAELRRRGLLPLVVATALSELPFSGPVAIAVVLLAQNRGWDPTVAGALLVAFSIGGLGTSLLLGSIPGRVLFDRRGTFRVLVGSLAASAIFLILLPAVDSSWVLAIGAALGATTGITMVVSHGRIQQATPPELLGRVTALLSLATLGLGPIAYGVVGAIVATTGLDTVFRILAGLLIVAGLILTYGRGAISRR